MESLDYLAFERVVKPRNNRSMVLRNDHLPDRICKVLGELMMI
jgi:hypothetical protein